MENDKSISEYFETVAAEIQRIVEKRRGEAPTVAVLAFWPDGTTICQSTVALTPDNAALFASGWLHYAKAQMEELQREKRHGKIDSSKLN